MKVMFRGYKVFTSVPYRWVVWFVYPVLALLGCAALQTGCFGFVPELNYGFGLPASILCSAIPAVEMIQDYFIFGGIHGKANAHFEYLKSSEQGPKMYRLTLIADQIRRVLTVFIICGGNVGIAALTGVSKETLMKNMAQCVFFATWTLFLACLGTFVGRFSSRLWLTVGIAYATNFLGVLGTFLFGIVLSQAWIEISITVVLIVLLWVLSLWLPLRKLERSYYDRED